MKGISNKLTRVVILKFLLRAYALTCKTLVALTVICIPPRTLASEQKSDTSIEAQPLQIEITQRDFKIIEQLVTIAQRHSALVQETRSAMGLSAFQDILFVELAPSQTRTISALPDTSSASERSFSVTITVDPIKLVGAVSLIPVREARWNEAKNQKRLTVVQHYLAYLQARQASKIAAYRIQKFAQSSRVASLKEATTSPREQLNYLANAEYTTAATEMLNASAREQLTLEELAACIGLSPQKIITLISAQ
jgi:hypothetical protein